MIPKLNFTFFSSSLGRYKKGNLISDFEDAERAINVVSKMDNDETYKVYIFNLNDDRQGSDWHWHGRMQPVIPMKEIIREQGKIVLRGYGADLFGDSFSEYSGLTIYLDGDIAYKCTQHFYLEKLDIEYRLAENTQKNEQS